MKVQDVCAAGDAEACERVKYTETGAFVGGLAGGAIVGGALGPGTASSICVALGVATAGTGVLVCGAVVIGGASLIAGISMEKGTELVAEKIYELLR